MGMGDIGGMDRECRLTWGEAWYEGWPGMGGQHEESDRQGG